MNAGAGRRWISVAECADRLGFHVVSVYKMVGRGELPAGRLGRCLRIDWPAVERKLEGERKKVGDDK